MISDLTYRGAKLIKLDFYRQIQDYICPVRKVLIITYYWPPSGGGGVQRWLKFVKYLRNYNWEPIIYTPDNPDFELKDDSLSRDVPSNLKVLKRPIWEPFSIYRTLLGKKAIQQQGVVANEKGGILNSLSVWIRGNFLIPDSRIFWVRPSVNYLTKYLKANPINVVVTTGPPHSLHLIGLELKKRLEINWVADFRDPWSRWDVLNQLKLSSRSRKSHKKLESNVLQIADLVITVSKSLEFSLKELGARNTKVITNGFDIDVAEISDKTPVKFRISHIGLLNQGRNPIIVWEVLNELLEERAEFKDHLEIYLSGTVENDVLLAIKEYSTLKPYLIHEGYIIHDQVITAYNDSAILLLLINQTDNAKWILPGKMYEYIATGKPVLALGNEDSDASDILVDAGYGACINYDDKDSIKRFILENYESYRNDKIKNNAANSHKYHRSELTKELASCLDQL